MSKIKYLNCYSGIGGNVKLLDRNEVEITAIEINPKIAEVYADLYPNDNIIVGDAHEYLRQHFREFNFIWASPPCPTHSVLQMTIYHNETLKYPDMTLYQEIIWLKSFFKGKWIIENVKPYYEPLIQPSFMIDRHYFWSSNFILSNQFQNEYDSIRNRSSKLEKAYKLNLDKYNINSQLKRTILRNCVIPEVGKYIYDKVIRGGGNVWILILKLS